MHHIFQAMSDAACASLTATKTQPFLRTGLNAGMAQQESISKGTRALWERAYASNLTRVLRRTDSPSMQWVLFLHASGFGSHQFSLDVSSFLVKPGGFLFQQSQCIDVGQWMLDSTCSSNYNPDQ